MNSSLDRSFFMLSLAASLLLYGSPLAIAAENAEPILLWPKGAPGEQGGLGEERDMTQPTDNLIAGKPVIRLGNVSKPTLAIYKPAPAADTGAAVVVCPGGGYNILALDLEGTEVCQWLNSIGVTGFLLKYRVPKRPDRERFEPPLQDAQRALGLVRHHAKDWKIDPRRIGILGFSAGAHLSAALSKNFNPRSYPRVDEADDQNCRPDFQILIYPGGLVKKDEGDRVSPEVAPSIDTPPAFIAMTMDDPVRVENALAYALALKNAKTSVELHVYPKGGHGYGLRPSEDPVAAWPKRAEDWMRHGGWLQK